PLVPYLQQGDIVIVENVFQYPENLLLTDSDSQKIPVSMPEIAGDLLLARRIKDTYDVNFAGKSNRPELIIGTVVTSSQTLSNRRVIASLQRDFGAVAVDREGSAVGHICRKHECSFLGVRTVTEKLSGHSQSSLNTTLETTMANLLILIECITTAPEMTSIV
ncbi:MAG: 5'-methylthioadenosine/S-adenosylhomocysteine nucleosidase, partial [FCB group bacterium]|nr:5'-methylthioadenosine/S-adenosylhomocysteine nucleosidase [FCB group bacterium]